MAKNKTASDALKLEAAKRLGLDRKLLSVGWANLTSGEIGNIVREMIKMGEEALVDSQLNDIPPLY
ncbi:MAG TPA: small, acid-soluble spore protein, alpha/beta type [Bacillota bacterium]|nr:small, acid-soluble spore protein, alpha/beta type [Bacillota bacterium]NLU55369.1 small, acid-soluble spore protein, alpha/beta type [Bacillota bacterium]HOA90587.1 small, acid-soluble spore protein, alpha/beta type [Bacillota bacterium]HOJ46649.1 small, acid-soluble spore protein, alpha/beta type [Bacillota bacterium]HOL13586.1 small, acid-soluble spore protein, alpha/beta type [Bacillota bacterium]